MAGVTGTIKQQMNTPETESHPTRTNKADPGKSRLTQRAHSGALLSGSKFGGSPEEL